MKSPDKYPRLPLPLGPYPLTAQALRATAAEAVTHGFAFGHAARGWPTNSTEPEIYCDLPEEDAWELMCTIEALHALAFERYGSLDGSVPEIIEKLVTDSVLTGASIYTSQAERRLEGRDAQVYLPSDPAWMAGVIAPLITDTAHALAGEGIILLDLTPRPRSGASVSEGAV